MRLIVLSDIHYKKGEPLKDSGRQCGIGEILLERAVRRIKLMERPDFVLVLGDLLDSGNLSHGAEEYRALRKILESLPCPWAAIPGNHDSCPGRFYEEFHDPGESLDFAGVRFAFFHDAETPGWNARRSVLDIARMERLRDDGWRGPLLSVQHTPLFRPGSASSPYKYDNASEIVEVLETLGFCATLSGHYHSGFQTLSAPPDFSALVAPALCEAPFRYMAVSIGEKGVEDVRVESLSMPPELRLQDLHVHSHLAYCSENMDVPKSLKLAGLFGLSGVCFTEHSSHLLFNRADHHIDCFKPGFPLKPEDSRVGAYLRTLERSGVPLSSRGLELDCRFDGSIIAEPEELERCPFKIGAVHNLKGLYEKSGDFRAIGDEFMRLNEALCRFGIKSMAHPFRIFTRNGLEAPVELFRPLARLFKRYSVAAELNYHTNNPPPEFFRICLEEGVKTCFGSDAHNLCEIGDFAPQLRLLKEIGFDGELDEILYRV